MFPSGTDIAYVYMYVYIHIHSIFGYVCMYVDMYPSVSYKNVVFIHLFMYFFV